MVSVRAKHPNVIRKRFSKELNDELTRKLSTEAYESIMENKDFKVYSILKVEPGSIDTNSGTSVDITYDIEPEFEIPDYENFQVTTEPVEVTDEDIDKELDAIREQRSTFEEVDRITRETTLNAVMMECLMVLQFLIWCQTSQCMGSNQILGRKRVNLKAWA